MRVVGRFRRIAMGCVVAMAVAAPAAHAGEKPDEDSTLLFPIVKEGKWGYMDETGKVKIEPKYDLALDFHEGLACVAVGPLRGFIDKTGEEVIKPQFGWCVRFDEGYAFACIRPKIFGSNMVDFYKGSLRWGMVNRSGKQDKKIKEGSHMGFREGKLIARRKFCIDRDGKPCEHDADELAPRFYDGLLAAKKGGKWGYLDHSMKWAVEPQFDVAGRFSEGLAAVGAFNPGAEKKRSYRLVTGDFMWGFIDKTGQMVVDQIHADVWHFSEGLASVKDKVSGKWGYMDKTGTMIIYPDYDYAWPLSEGMGRVMMGEKQGFVNKEGKLAIKPMYEPAWEFSKGLARVGIGQGKDYVEGYIDKKGKTVWEPTK